MKKGDYESNRRGFTIIEVALVIAIAGLIFLMVFVALPGLRASQKDAERREDMTTMLESLKKYQTNNRGALPMARNADGTDEANHMTETERNDYKDFNTWQGFYNDYLGDSFYDPSGEHYTLVIRKCGTTKTVQAGELCESLSDTISPYTNAYPNGYRMVIVTQATCRDQNVVGTNNPRKVAVIYRLEGSGIYCTNT